MCSPCGGRAHRAAIALKQYRKVSAMILHVKTETPVGERTCAIYVEPKFCQLLYYLERPKGEKATAMWRVYLHKEDTEKLHSLLKESLGRGFPDTKK
jgi:hypothetical protein